MFEQSNIFKSGKIGEVIIIKYLELIKNEKVKLISINKYFDVMTNNNIMYEIKTQYHTLKSGWVALEFQTFNKPSGIITTYSNMFIYLIPDLEQDIFYIYEIETNELKELIKNNKLKKISFTYDEINEDNLNYNSFKHFFYECKIIRKNINIKS